jgi:hypothetical protein
MAVSLIIISTHHIHSSITANGAWINIAAGPTFPLLAAVLLRATAIAAGPSRTGSPGCSSASVCCAR